MATSIISEGKTTNEAIENGDASIDEDSKLLLTNDNVLSQGSFDDLQKNENYVIVFGRN